MLRQNYFQGVNSYHSLFRVSDLMEERKDSKPKYSFHQKFQKEPTTFMSVSSLGQLSPLRLSDLHRTNWASLEGVLKS